MGRHRRHSNDSLHCLRSKSQLPLACSVCDTGIAELATGIRLVGNMFASHSISCALIGGVADSAYVRNGLMKVLTQNAGRRYKFIEPRLSPAAGAVLLAL